jgi:hypothetical protein
LPALRRVCPRFSTSPRRPRAIEVQGKKPARLIGDELQIVISICR